MKKTLKTLILYTGILNNKNKKESRDIFINASNSDANKYNVVTFERIELNVVGADASVRPQIEKDDRTGRPKDAQFLQLLTKPKYKNNVKRSNIQHPTSNTAITLIALIITIIVLLILSGVTLSMVMGESGIFGKANWTKFVTEFRNVEEAEHLYEINNQLDENKEQTKNNYAITQTTIEATGTLKDTIIENEEDENPQLYIIDLSKLNLTEIKNEYVINVNSGKIYRKEGFSYNNKIYHTPDSGSNEENVENNKTLGYVEDGLKVLYDGKQNTKDGHNNESTTWENLIEDEEIKNSMDGQLQNVNFTTESGWTENSLILDGIDDWVKMGYFYKENMTIEICAKPLDVSIGKQQYYIDNLQTGGISIKKDEKDSYCGYIYTSEYKKISNNKNIKLNQIYSMSTGIDNKKMYFNENENHIIIDNSKKFKAPETTTIFVLGTNPRGDEEGLGDEEARTNMEVYSVRIYDRCLTQEEVKQNYENDKKRFNIQEIPEIKTPDYVTDGLVSLLDAEKNTKYGHSKRTSIWQNLVGTTNASLKNVNNTLASGWTENSLVLDGKDDWVNVGYYHNSNMSIEIVAEPLNIVNDKNQYYLANVQSGGIRLWKKNNNIGGMYISGYKNLNSTNIVETNKIYSMSTGFNGTEMYFMENGTKYKANYTGNIGKPNSSTVFAIAVDPSGTSDGTGGSEARFNMKVYSVRIYNRCLTEDEINHNYEIDKARFGITE